MSRNSQGGGIRTGLKPIGAPEAEILPTLREKFGPQNWGSEGGGRGRSVNRKLKMASVPFSCLAPWAAVRRPWWSAWCPAGYTSGTWFYWCASATECAALCSWNDSSLCTPPLGSYIRKAGQNNNKCLIIKGCGHLISLVPFLERRVLFLLFHKIRVFVLWNTLAFL